MRFDFFRQERRVVPNRLLRPLLNADKPPANTDIRHVLSTLEHAVNDYTHAARLAA